MICSFCGCSHEPFGPNEIPYFTPNCQCQCHKVQITWFKFPPDTTGFYEPIITIKYHYCISPFFRVDE